MASTFIAEVIANEGQTKNMVTWFYRVQVPTPPNIEATLGNWLGTAPVDSVGLNSLIVYSLFQQLKDSIRHFHILDAHCVIAFGQDLEITV